jgi:hypothetical protein
MDTNNVNERLVASASGKHLSVVREGQVLALPTEWAQEQQTVRKSVKPRANATRRMSQGTHTMSPYDLSPISPSASHRLTMASSPAVAMNLYIKVDTRPGQLGLAYCCVSKVIELTFPTGRPRAR